MSKGDSGLFSGTNGSREEICQRVVDSLPENPEKLVSQGWKEISHPNAAVAGHREFVNGDTGFKIRFDKAQENAPGHNGKDHYHIKNPISINDSDYYLDKDGKPVPKGSSASHIYPKEK